MAEIVLENSPEMRDKYLFFSVSIKTIFGSSESYEVKTLQTISNFTQLYNVRRVFQVIKIKLEPTKGRWR